MIQSRIYILPIKMKHISLIFLHFCCCFLFQTSNATVPVGVITNPNTRIGREQKVAIKLAIDSFSTIDSVLLLNATDLNGSDSLQGISIAQDLIQWGAKVIITTGTSEQVLLVGTTATGAKTAAISLMPSVFVTGPFTFQISYSDSAFVRCISDFVKLHGWKKIITIYEDDSLGLVSNVNLLLENALRDNGIKIEYHAVFQLQNSMTDLEERVELELRQLMQYESTVYVVLRSSEVLALSLFHKVKVLNMMSPRYIWICGNDITDLLNSTLSPSFMAANMQGVVGIKSCINESLEYRIFSSNFQKAFASNYGKNNENFFNPGVYAVRAYDAVRAISQASNESKTKNISLVEALSLVQFEGLSGKIVPKNNTFDNSEMVFPVYRIFGIVRENYANLGFWHDNSGSKSDMRNLSWLYGLIWHQNFTKPGGLRKLRVGIPAHPFWQKFVNVEINSTINCSAEVKTENVSGFCIDVFTKALEFLKYNVSYQFIAYTTESNSLCNVKKYNDLANLVNSQEVDLVVGDVTILADRLNNVSFTQPFLTSELVMMVQTKNTNIGWLSVKPFSLGLWICIVFIILYFILLVWLLEFVWLLENDPQAEADSDFHDSILKQVAASFWLLCNSIFLKIDEGVRSYHTKIVLLWWFLLVQVLLSSFIASLSSILVSEKLYPKIDKLKVGYNSESFVYDYLQSTFNYKPENLVKINKSDEFVKAFKNGNITAAYLELPYLRVFLSEHSNFAANGESRTFGGFGFVFPKYSPLRGDFSTAILRLQENGTIMELQSRWFNTSLYSSTTSGKQRTESILEIENFAFLFISITCLAMHTALHKMFF